MADPDRFTGTRIPDPGFADDAGAPPEDLTQALTAYAADPSARYAETLAVLQRSRLLVPVVAVLGEVEIDDEGLAHDKSSDMAAVLMQGKDGRLALLAFTSMDSLRAWNQEARPVPVPTQLAARSALQDLAAAIVVDIAGPVRFVVQEADLHGLAEGWTLTQVGGRSAWLRPQ